jgi:hypothetical protein
MPRPIRLEDGKLLPSGLGLSSLSRLPEFQPEPELLRALNRFGLLKLLPESPSLSLLPNLFFPERLKSLML